jgi:hypothetical protein
MASIRHLAAAALVAIAVPLAAQQDVPMNGNTPRAPQGIKIPPLPDAPVRFETGEGQTIRVSVYARGFNNPWSMAWVSDDTMLVAERGGAIKIVRNGVVDPQPVPWRATGHRRWSVLARTSRFIPISSAITSSTSATPSRLTHRRAGARLPCSRACSACCCRRCAASGWRRGDRELRDEVLPDKAPGLAEGEAAVVVAVSRRRWPWLAQSGTARGSPT